MAVHYAFGPQVDKDLIAPRTADRYRFSPQGTKGLIAWPLVGHYAFRPNWLKVLEHGPCSITTPLALWVESLRERPMVDPTPLASKGLKGLIAWPEVGRYTFQSLRG